MAATIFRAIACNEIQAAKFGFGVAPTVPDATGISATNWTSDTSFDCNTAADAEIADVLATLIKILQTKGILGGSVSA